MQLVLSNPPRRKRRKARARRRRASKTAPRRRRRRKMIAAQRKFFAPKTRRRRRRRAASAGVQPVARRRSRRRVSRRSRRRGASLSAGFGGGKFAPSGLLMNALAVTGGALGSNFLVNKLPLPAAAKTGNMRPLAQLAVGLAGYALLRRFAGGKTAALFAIGAASSVASQVLNRVMGAGALSGLDDGSPSSIPYSTGPLFLPAPDGVSGLGDALVMTDAEY